MTPDTPWIKSSRSGGTNGSNCVELRLHSGQFQLRDSKNPSGPTLQFTVDTLTTFLTATKAGTFDRH